MTTLPPTNSDYWEITEDVYTNLVELNSLTSECKHDLQVDLAAREVKCKLCTLTFKFKVENVEVKDGFLYNKILKQKIAKL